MSSAELFRIRVTLVQAWLRDRGYDGVLLTRHDNFSMATGGKRNYIYTMSELGSNSLFITKEGKAFFVGNTIEKPRIMDEELAGFDADVCDFLWFNESAGGAVSKKFTGSLVSDDGSLGKNVHEDLACIRALLTEVELEKYRRLGRLAAEAMAATLDAIKPGTAEIDIAATLVAEGRKRRCLVPVALVAADDRIAKYRHPLPTEAPLLGTGLEEKAVRGYVMVVGCFHKEGLVVSMTRFKQVGELPHGLSDTYARICAVDAVMQEATQPGQTLGDVFAACQWAYQEFGFPQNEWHNHHQGGATGYAGRTKKGTPGEPFPVGDTVWASRVSAITGSRIAFGSAFAWNPSAVGVKSEDTFILTPEGTREIVTLTPSLPRVDLASVLGRETDVVKSGISR
ncbi:MAG: hypothetical protein AMXMBFR84_51070 [Candidatus Hydrogenedentota bacterium]